MVWEDAGTAAARLGVHRKTLIRWAHAGLIVGARPNPNGKWFFDASIQSPLVQQNAGAAPADGESTEPVDDGRVKAIYARVSTRKQLDDLESQVATLKARYPDHVVFSDCASGLNFKRKGLLSLLQLAFAGRLQLVRIAHRDRLCRFAYDLLEYVLRQHGAAIHVEASDLPATAERELAEDVLAVITVFGARLHGARSAGRRGRRTAASRSIEEAEAVPAGGEGISGEGA